MKKKMVTILLALCLASSVGACGNSKSNSVTSEAENSSLQKVKSALSKNFEDIDVADSQTSDGSVLYVTASENTDSYDLGTAIGQIINESWFDYDNLMMSQYVDGKFCVSNLFRSSDQQMGTYVWLDDNGNIIGSESTNEETVNVPESNMSESSFKNDILTTSDAVIKITGIEVAPPNEEYGETLPTLVLTYDYTNNSDEPQEPGIVWISSFNATQETETTIDDLDIASAPRDEKYDAMNEMSYTDVKPGATVQSVISYDINYSDQPVTLVASDGIAGDEIGTKVINLQ